MSLSGPMKKASFSKHGAIEMLVENSRTQQHQLNTAYYKPFDIDYDQTWYNWTLVTMAHRFR